MKIIKIEPGTRYGLLTIIKEVERIVGLNGRAYRQFLCRCDCGNETVVRLCNLRSGTTKSCGCLIGKNGITHHEAGTRLYHRWTSMKRRCLSPNDDHYCFYGGRGISICSEWMEYEPFRDWSLANGYADELTLDRIDVNGNYEPSNCRWVGMKIQANNKRTNHYITYNGITKSAQEWSDISGIPASTLIFRHKHNWPSDKMLVPVNSQKPRKPHKTDKYKSDIISWFQQGITKTEIAKRVNIGRNHIHASLKRWGII